MSTSMLSQSEVAGVYGFLLRYFAQTGRPPSSVIIAEAMELSPETVESALGMIEGRGSIYREPTTREILAAYPFSARPTDHRVRFPDGHRVYSMCAIDALGMPTMLGTDAIIESRCAQCGRDIRVEVKQNALAEYAPRETRVWYMTFDQGCKPGEKCIAALEQSPSINFFCSPEHLAAWHADHPDAPGEAYDIEKAFLRGAAIFGKLLKPEAHTTDGPAL